MDMKRKNDVFKADLSRKYFLGGVAFLPFLWLINGVWFFKDAFLRDVSVSEDRRRIRRYVILSIVGCLIWSIGLTTWLVIFQTHRVEWGATADYMSFIIPVGVPWVLMGRDLVFSLLAYPSVIGIARPVQFISGRRGQWLTYTGCLPQNRTTSSFRIWCAHRCWLGT